MTLLLMLAAARKLPQADRFTRSGNRAKGSFGLAHRMFGKRLGIVGLGRIGQEIAKRVCAFEMEVAYTGRSEKPDQP
jgi:lactate dehydrogenase-like 2-hydroxyacid dehydrogenase